MDKQKEDFEEKIMNDSAMNRTETTKLVMAALKKTSANRFFIYK